MLHQRVKAVSTSAKKPPNYLATIATSLGLLRKSSQFNNRHANLSIKSENLVKISPVLSEIFGANIRSLRYRLKRSNFYRVISDVTGSKFTKFVHDVEGSLAL